jgi:hypothetical protein
MKKAIFMWLLALPLALISVSSCSNDDPPEINHHETVYSGTDSAVKITCLNSETNQTETFFMQYLLFHHLFNYGGYQAVYNRYQMNPTHFDSRNYSQYKPAEKKYLQQNTYYNKKPSANNNSL